MSHGLRIASRLLFWLMALAGAAWAGMALWLHLGGIWLAAALGALAAALLVALFAHRHRPALGWAALALAALTVGSWYQTITPRQDRAWAPDVARGVVARKHGDTVTLRNIRDFDWTAQL